MALGALFVTNPLGIATIIVVGALFLAVDFYSLHALDKRDIKFKKEHPQLADFKKRIQDLQALEGKAKNLSQRRLMIDYGRSVFRKLSTTQKERICEELYLAMDDDRKTSLNQAIEKRLGTKEGESTQALKTGKEFYEMYKESPAVKKVENAFIILGYKKEQLLSKEVEERFYSAIYDQVVLEIREAVYEQASLEELEKAVDSAREGLKERAVKLKEVLGVKNKLSWSQWFSFRFAKTA